MKSDNRRDSSSNVPSSLKRRVAYTLAASAAAAATDAQAVVVYSGPQNLSITQGNSQLLNLDGDAFNDIRLKNYVFGGGNYQGAAVSFSPGKLVGFSSGNAYVTALSAGFNVNAGSVGSSFFGSMAYGAVNPNAQFNNAVDKYVGFSFPISGSTYYGWVRVNVNNAAGTFLIKDWAYDNVANHGIATGTVPEPGTLGMLAAGAAGLAAMRRKRKPAAA